MSDIKERVKVAVNKLLREDGELLRNNTSEQAVTHRLAVHIASILPKWHVDCEYNRDMETIKRLKYSLSENGNIAERSVIPDIIVHKRETANNLLVVEVKKSTNSEPDDADLRKLQAFHEQLGYEYAVFFRFAAAAGDQDPAVIREVWVDDL